ncbi:hypothetical protein KEF29_09020 [Streptomyces tuirus]|uniref:Uncharacterized protein n=1 Tax=Streptomyces tuirus TaxID=68278 RepID=A0A941FG32_9ACTN|nr:hypothetical protein [Streptomyces tuirus]
MAGIAESADAFAVEAEFRADQPGDAADDAVDEFVELEVGEFAGSKAPGGLLCRRAGAGVGRWRGRGRGCGCGRVVGGVVWLVRVVATVAAAAAARVPVVEWPGAAAGLVVGFDLFQKRCTTGRGSGSWGFGGG